MSSDGVVAIAEAVRAAGVQVHDDQGAVRDAVRSLVKAYGSLEGALAVAVAALPRAPVEAERAAQADATDRRILAALAEGVPRTAVWKRLGMRRRDVDERMQRMHALAESSTLFMLATRAVEYGWLVLAPSSDERTVQA